MKPRTARGWVEAGEKAPPKVREHRGRQKGGERMYTEYGYEMNGIEYATIDEAYENSE